ncbi:unnamed protein product [Bursaphelenchus xylophilus]|uniref:(pine wood nematode) hypothetical protein n=1 Tax=Bursaphelenchus xylophilus TaxID=6326 RepID=A0A1I7SF12_BURXY|nr:unnamed protein product [Bursaphelenchus xylophilus]CAG9088843.1 unnamed protein product [Bursaphelenchus xylophilus]
MKAFNTNKDVANLSYDYIFQRIKYRPFEFFHSPPDLEAEAGICKIIGLNVTLYLSFQHDQLEFYRKIFANLKKSAPNLRNITLNGGYMYGCENGTTEDWLEEIELISGSYNAIIQAAKEAEITVDHFFADIRLAFPYNAIISADPSTLLPDAVHLIYREHLGRYGYVLNAEETHLISLQLPTFFPTNLHMQITPFREEMKNSEWRFREDPKLEEFAEKSGQINDLSGAVSMDVELKSLKEEFYQKCFANLKNGNENLKMVTLEGGHKSRIGTKTTKDLDSEIKTLLTAIRAVIRGSKAAELPLKYFVYHTEWFFDYSKRPISFPFLQIIQRYINADAIEDTTAFTFDYNVEGLIVTIHVRLIFDPRPFSITLPKKCPFYSQEQYPIRSFIDLTSQTLQVKFLEDLPFITEPFTEFAVRSLHKIQRIYFDPINENAQDAFSFYKKCLEILKEYRYIEEPLGLYSESHVNVDGNLEEELKILQNNLIGLTRALNETKMETRTPTVVVDYSVIDKLLKSSNWTKLVENLFNHQVNDVEKKENMMVMEYTANEVKIRMLLGFNMKEKRPSGFQLSFFNDHV